MADKKEFVTSLVVEADDAQVAKLRDTLQQVSTLIQGIQSRGAIGGGGPGGGGGAGGANGGGGWGPGGSGSGGPGGWGGGQGGGGGGGQGGGQPPQQGGPKQYGVGVAQIATQQDEGILSSAASALPSPLPLLGVALGAVAGAAVSATLARGRQYLEFDRQRSATLGLLGAAPSIGAGSGLGFMPGESQSQAQGMAQSGLSADDLFGDASTMGAFGPRSFKRGPKSLFEAGLLAERAGIGSGSVSSFLGMFRAGGGGELSYGVRNGEPIQGITDPMRMENALGVAVGSAIRAGLQNADIPKYLAKIQGAVTAMADKGVTVDPSVLALTAERVAQMSGRKQIGTIGVGTTTGMLSIAQQVGMGGGTPMQQYIFRKAGGLGQPGVDALDVSSNLLHDANIAEKVIRELRMAGGGSDRNNRALAWQNARDLNMTPEALYAALSGPDPEGVDAVELAKYGNEELLKRGRRGASGLMGREASIEAGKISSGREAADVALRARQLVAGFTNDIAPKVAKGLGKIIDIATGKRSIADVMLDVESDYQERTFVPDDGSTPTAAPLHRKYGKPPKVAPIPGHPATQLPDPKKGSGYIEIRPAPGMERFFQFIYMQDMSATELPA